MPPHSHPPSAVRHSLPAAWADAYDASVHALTDAVQSLAARPSAPEPAARLARVWSDALRDVTAIQLSVWRWALDL